MRFVIRKYIEAASLQEALAKEPLAPVHEIYLKEGEEPNGQAKDLIGFTAPPDGVYQGTYTNEPVGKTST